MDENRKNFQNVKEGVQTRHGTVARLLATADDFVIFFNEDGKLKILSERKDEVYKAATLQTVKLSTQAGRKFQGVHQERIDQLLGLGMSSALKKGVKLNDVEKIFDSARDYITQEKPIKRLIGSGRKYRYRVFLDHRENLGWECGEMVTDEHLLEQFSKIDRLCRIVNSQIPKWFRADITAAMGAAVLTLFNTTNHKERELAVDEATTHSTRKVREFHHAQYFLSLSSTATVIGILVYFFAGVEVPLVWKIGMSGGIAGSIISSLQRTETNSFDLTQSRTNVIVQAISRVLIGAASGLLVIVASKSGIAFGIIEGNEHAAALLAFAAGFSERFIPDILTRVMSETKIS